VELGASYAVTAVKIEPSNDNLSTPSCLLPLTRDYCFCPHGYISHSLGHFHCRQCGESFKFLSQVNRHEKSHKELFTSSRNNSSARTEIAITLDGSLTRLGLNEQTGLTDKVPGSGKCCCSLFGI